MSQWRKAVGAIIVVVLMALTGCATQSEPFEYRSDTEHMRGRGLFSGEDGYFTIGRQPPTQDDKTAEEADSKNKSEKQESHP